MERAQGSGDGWSSLLSGLPGVVDEEDHEGWVERLFGNERSGATSPPQPGLLGFPPSANPSQSKNKRQRRAPAAAQSKRRTNEESDCVHRHAYMGERERGVRLGGREQN